MNTSNFLMLFFQWLCRFNFGNFENEEFKKFVRMGLIFSIIIGVYWTLRPLKDSIFIQLVDKMQLPYAKTVSVLALIPFVIFYTKLLAKSSKEKMLKILPIFYGISILCFSLVILLVQSSLEEIRHSSLILILSVRALGYIWYLFVESFGSLVVALFWAFATDSTDPDHAKRGFPLVYAIGQLGGIIIPYFIGGMPHRLNLKSDFISLICLSILTFFIISLVGYFLKNTPEELLKSYKGNRETKSSEKHEATFLEGLKLILKNPYLLCMFAVNFIFEIIVTIFDFNFKILASSAYSGVELSNYLSLYASSVNIVSLACLLLGISNVSRFLGISVSLAAMPIIVGSALLGFLSFNTLSFLFTLMVGSKAINYALNGPALKQLYIPTSPDVKFKAQAWIETFGSRLSKQTGSTFNMTLSPLQSSFGAIAGRSYYLMLSSIFCFPLLGLWLFVAIFLGTTYRKAIQHNKVIC